MRDIRVQRKRAPRNIEQDGLKRNQRALRGSSFPASQDKKYFAWGKIIKVRSDSNDADVVLDTGLRLNHVSVSSREWAGSNTSVGFGSRDLPPKDALVLIVFPYGTVDDALILCSAFTLFGQHTEKWKTDILVSGKEREEKKVMENGDTIVYNKDTGEATWTMTGPVKLVVNEAEIEITSAGIVNIKSKAGQTINVDGGIVNIKAETGKAVNINGGPNVVINNGTVAVNDLVSCPVTGCLHSIAGQSVKVP